MMSGTWQQGYPQVAWQPQSGGYGQPTGYPQAGFPQHGYGYEQAAQAQHGAYQQAYGYEQSANHQHGAAQYGTQQTQYGQYVAQQPHQPAAYPQANYQGQGYQAGPYQAPLQVASHHGQQQMGPYQAQQQMGPYQGQQPGPRQGQQPHATYQTPQQSVPFQNPQPTLPQQQVPQQAQPPSTHCFNCGNPNHWAQDCPEPRRQVPYGDTGQQNKTKRFRPTYKPPVITKYHVPPHAGQPQPTPPYTAAPTWPPQPPSLSYPTPNSATPSPAAWNGPNPFVMDHYSQAPTPDSHHGQHGQPGQSGQWHSAPQHYPSAQHDIPTPPYGPDHGHDAASGSHSGTQTKAGSQEADAKAILQEFMTMAGAKIEIKAESQLGAQLMSRNNSQVSMDQSVEMETDSDDEDGAEDYLKFDIPDLPNLNAFAGSKPPQLVAHPLPAIWNSDEAGELVPPGGDGKVKSKYQLDSPLLRAHVRYTDEWDNVEDDPIFFPLGQERSATQSRHASVARRTPDRESAERYSARRESVERQSRRESTPYRDYYEPREHDFAYQRDSDAPRRCSTPPYLPEYDGPACRESTPGYTEHYEPPANGAFDPFDPATGNLEGLVRQYSDTTGTGTAHDWSQIQPTSSGAIDLKTGASVTYHHPKPPPPPPPPPPEPYYPSRGYHETPRGYHESDTRRRSSTAAYSPDRGRDYGSGRQASPQEHQSRKRRHDDDELSRREGRRQRDDEPKRRNAPKVADVYSRRW